jgi:galactose mutarotase-like enzyme
VSSAPSHRVSEGEREGFGLLELHSPAGLVASYAPGAGLVCCSLRHRGAELLGQRNGLRAYASRGSTMGIPLLHPWANRLARWGYAVGDVRVDLPSGSPLVHDDGRGLPIHGLVADCPHWLVQECDAASDEARLVAELGTAAWPELLALFPFPHVLRMEVVLRDSTLEITTVLRATGDRAVPVAFGEAYRVAVVYAPAADDVVCFEPMTAPTNPFEGGAELARVNPGHELCAHFRIRVT